MDYVVGVDIGTSSVKALALNPRGELLGTAQKAYPADTDPSGKYEEDPERITRDTLTVLHELIQSIQGHKLKAVSFSAAMHGLIALEGDTPLTPLITWADTRAATVPVTESYYTHTGVPLHPMSPYWKLIWLRTAFPEVFARATRFISIKEYIWYRLFGVYEIDYSLASATGLFDTPSLGWYAPALEAACVSPAQLSTPVPVTFSRVSSEFGVPFVIGASDGCLANLGTGVLSPGEAALTIGTSGAVRVVTSSWQPDPQERLFQYYLFDRMYVRGGATNNGGNVVEWFRGIVAAPLEELLTEAFTVPPGSEGLLFLPYLYGERAPIWDANARGAFVGLRSHHTRAHMLRSVTEGIGFALGEILRLLEPIHLVHASGGFTRSEAWVQQLANILGKPIRLTEEGDASATGAALLGMLALGYFSRLEEARGHIREGRTFEPLFREPYIRLAGLYQDLYPALKSIFIKL